MNRVLELLSNGVEVNVKRESDGRTALMCASAEGHLDVVKLLLRHKADATIEDFDNCSALHLALFNNRRMVVEILEPVYGTVFFVSTTRRYHSIISIALFVCFFSYY